MPRRRPRVRQSVVDRTTWGAAGQPPDQFDLTFDNGTFDYTYDPGGGAPPVSLLGLAPLLGLIVAADGLPPPSVDAWAGLAQPLEIQCRISAGATERLPPNFECRFTHPHQRWAFVDERGDDGNFRGLVKGMHQHVFRMDEWVLAEIEVAPGPPGQPPQLETRWFARHVH